MKNKISATFAISFFKFRNAINNNFGSVSGKGFVHLIVFIIPIKLVLKKIINGLIILNNSLNKLNSYFLVSFIGKISVLVLLLYNYQIIKNNKLNLVLKIFKLLGIILLLNKIYKNNYEYLLFKDLLLYIFIFFIISLIITEFKVLLNKVVLFNKIKVINLFIISNLFSISRMMSVNNLSTKDNDENQNQSLDLKDNIKPQSSENPTNTAININAEDMVKKGVETVNKTLETGVIKAATQIALSGNISAGLTAGATISAGQPIFLKEKKMKIARTVGLGLAGGAIHEGASSINRSLISMSLDNDKNYINKDINNDSPPSPGNGFINSPNEEFFYNPVELLLYSIWVIDVVVLVFLFILLFTFISKLIFSLNYKLNWLDKIFSTERSNKIRIYILKLLKTLSTIREFNIIMLIITLIFLSLCSLYFYSVFCFNLEGMCKLYLKIYIESKDNK